MNKRNKETTQQKLERIRQEYTQLKRELPKILLGLIADCQVEGIEHCVKWVDEATIQIRFDDRGINDSYNDPILIEVVDEKVLPEVHFKYSDDLELSSLKSSLDHLHYRIEQVDEMLRWHRGRRAEAERRFQIRKQALEKLTEEEKKILFGD